MSRRVARSLARARYTALVLRGGGSSLRPARPLRSRGGRAAASILGIALGSGLCAADAAALPDPPPSEDIESRTKAAEPDPPPTAWGIRQIGFDARTLFSRPFEPESARTGAAVAGAAFGLFLLREEARDFAIERRSPGRTRLLERARTQGKGAFAPTLALGAFLASLGTRSDRERETAVLLLESMAFSAGIAAAGQIVLASDRPSEGEAVRFFETGGHGVSMDAALAASVVPPMRRQYLEVRPEDGRGRRFWKRLATGVLYAGAGLVAYQRLDADQHWAPDAFLGTVVGLGVGEILCEAHDRTRALRRARALAAERGRDGPAPTDAPEAGP